jgi:hypothetical protein
VEYDIAPLKESMKIHYFEEGIKDPSLNAARNTILVNRSQFPDFESVMQLYVTSKRSQKSDSGVSQGCQLSAVTGGRGGGRGGGGAGHGGRGRGDPNARRKGLVSQADIDKVTTVKNKHYPEAEYAKFTPAEKAKHGSSGTQGRNAAPVLPVAGSPESVRPTFPTLLPLFPLLCRQFLRSLTRPSALPMKRSPTTTHPTARTLPWLASKTKRPKPKTDPLPIAYLPFEPFVWQLTLNIILLTSVLK